MTVAKSVSRYCNFFRYQGTETVLDYGAGKLRNSRYLAEQGFTVFAADLPDQVERLRGSPCVNSLAGVLDSDQLAEARLNVDLVLSTYVFNIISESTEKNKYVDNILRNLKMGGYLLMEVRCRQLDSCGDSCSHFFKCPDCARTFTHQELDSFLLPHGFRRISHYYRKHAVAAIYQLEP